MKFKFFTVKENCGFARNFRPKFESSSPYRQILDDNTKVRFMFPKTRNLFLNL